MKKKMKIETDINVDSLNLGKKQLDFTKSSIMEHLTYPFWILAMVFLRLKRLMAILILVVTTWIR